MVIPIQTLTMKNITEEAEEKAMSRQPVRWVIFCFYGLEFNSIQSQDDVTSTTNSGSGTKRRRTESPEPEPGAEKDEDKMWDLVI